MSVDLVQRTESSRLASASATKDQGAHKQHIGMTEIGTRCFPSTLIFNLKGYILSMATNENSEELIHTIFIAQVDGTWSVHLVKKRIVYSFQMNYTDNGGTVVTRPRRNPDRINDPKQLELTQILQQPVQACYRISGGITQILQNWTLQEPWNDGDYLRSGLGDHLQWCVAALDHLESIGAVARGETLAFIHWLQNKSAEMARNPGGPQLYIPGTFDDYIKTLQNTNISVRPQEIKERELTGKSLTNL